MKPKILCCFALIAIMLSHMQDGYSQQALYLGAKGGLGIPNLQDGTNEQNPLNAGFSSRLGVNIGVLAEFQITDWFRSSRKSILPSRAARKTDCKHLFHLTTS